MRNERLEPATKRHQRHVYGQRGSAKACATQIVTVNKINIKYISLFSIQWLTRWSHRVMTRQLYIGSNGITYEILYVIQYNVILYISIDAFSKMFYYIAFKLFYITVSNARCSMHAYDVINPNGYFYLLSPYRTELQ